MVVRNNFFSEVLTKKKTSNGLHIPDDYEEKPQNKTNEVDDQQLSQSRRESMMSSFND